MIRRAAVEEEPPILPIFFFFFGCARVYENSQARAQTCATAATRATTGTTTDPLLRHKGTPVLPDFKGDTFRGVPAVVQRECWDTGSIPSPAQWVKDPALLQPKNSMYLGVAKKKNNKGDTFRIFKALWLDCFQGMLITTSQVLTKGTLTVNIYIYIYIYIFLFYKN